MTVRPLIKSMVTPQSADWVNRMQPLRMQRYATSSHNPMMNNVEGMAELVREKRQPAASDNPFRQLEQASADMVTQWWDGIRDIQDFWIESSFHWLYSTPHAKSIGANRSRRISDAPQEDLRSLVEVQEALDRMEEGGFAEGVIRMLIFLARSRGEVRRSRLQRSNEILEKTAPFAEMKPKHRTRLIHRESLIVAFEPDAALETLPHLFHDYDEKARALEICLEVAGPEEEMTEATLIMLKKLEKLLMVEGKVPQIDVQAKKGNGKGRKPAAA
jgi:tellurite resistance protein